METITAPTGRDAYAGVVAMTRTFGQPRLTRGLMTRDLGYAVIELTTPYDAFPIGVRPKLSWRIACAEAVQLIGGFTSPDLLLRASPNFHRFLEPDGHFHGAYGARVRYQVANVCTKLQEDRGTRRAVVTLWDPTLDNLADKRDYPCTVMLHFEVNYRNQLCMNTVMRSNDVWLGLPYDMFQFTQLQLSVARSLDLEPGMYRHTTMSLHMYETDIAESLMLDVPDKTWKHPTGLGRPSDSFTTIMKRARVLTTEAKSEEETTGERFFRTHLTPELGSALAGHSSSDRAA